MNLLKRIPIKYWGELHDIRLINFSIEKNELVDKIPGQLKLRDYNGRALVSMVDVQLKRMHPSFVPSSLNFNYRHIAFRVLIDDGCYNAGLSKGIYFFRSFTDHPFIVMGGSCLTDYHLEYGQIYEQNEQVILKKGNESLRYSIKTKIRQTDSTLHKLKDQVGSIDRAYSVLNDKIRVTQIVREKWPIEPVDCQMVENTFFKSAKLEGAFKVFETIYYQWLPPKNVKL